MPRSSWTDTAIWIVLFILLVPSGLVVGSWNSLPGSNLYAVKIAAENALVAVAPTQQAKGELQVAYTQRRFSEATTLLNDASNPTGLENFRAQVEKAKEAIAQAPPGPARTQLVQQYVASLQTASMQLEQQRQVFNRQVPDTQTTNPTPQVANSAAAPIIVNRPVVNQINQVTQVVQVTKVVQVVNQITQTENVINNTINEVSTLDSGSSGTPTDTSTPAPQTPPPPPPTISTIPVTPSTDTGKSDYMKKTHSKDGVSSFGVGN